MQNLQLQPREVSSHPALSSGKERHLPPAIVSSSLFMSGIAWGGLKATAVHWFLSQLKEHFIDFLTEILIFSIGNTIAVKTICGPVMFLPGHFIQLHLKAL